MIRYIIRFIRNQIIPTVDNSHPWYDSLWNSLSPLFGLYMTSTVLLFSPLIQLCSIADLSWPQFVLIMASNYPMSYSFLTEAGTITMHLSPILTRASNYHMYQSPVSYVTPNATSSTIHSWHLLCHHSCSWASYVTPNATSTTLHSWHLLCHHSCSWASYVTPNATSSTLHSWHLLSWLWLSLYPYTHHPTRRT
jgi:hypothetical protein